MEEGPVGGPTPAAGLNWQKAGRPPPGRHDGRRLQEAALTPGGNASAPGEDGTASGGEVSSISASRHAGQSGTARPGLGGVSRPPLRPPSTPSPSFLLFLDCPKRRFFPLRAWRSSLRVPAPCSTSGSTHPSQSLETVEWPALQCGSVEKGAPWQRTAAPLPRHLSWPAPSWSRVFSACQAGRRSSSRMARWHASKPRRKLARPMPPKASIGATNRGRGHSATCSAAGPPEAGEEPRPPRRRR